MSHGGSPSTPTPLPSPRIIPAYAGNALPERLPGPPDAVHPLIRGERSQHPADGEPDAGSSPHARGTHRGGDDPIRPVRFIPTCAGNALVPGQFAGRVSVHPRIRGERNEGPSMCRPPLALTPARVRRAPSRINATGLRPYQTSASAPVAVRRSRCALIQGRRIS